MDRSLDEILAEKRNNGPRNRRGTATRGTQRRDRPDDFPRDGIRKSYRDEPRHLDSEWVHDRFEEHNGRRAPVSRRRGSPDAQTARGAKIRVENLHYELTESDLEELFNRIGPVLKLDIRYDRAGRSEGTAFVTYESHDDAVQAIKEFDGANAKGQPIRLTLMPSGPAPRNRNPFDSAYMPGRPLAERITAPSGRSRSLSPNRNSHYDDDDSSTRKGIDRYVPGRRSRSPLPRRRGGRRPGNRREVGRDNEAARGGSRRPKKTQEELDADMDDYFGGGDNAPAAATSTRAIANDQRDDDTDMIE